VGGQAHGEFRQGAVVARRNKLIFIAWVGTVLILGAVFANLTVKALHVRAATSSEFTQYVADHNIGWAEISTDFSRIQQDFCLLHVDHEIPASQLQSQLMDWIYQYHRLDGGHSLTVEYDVPNQGKKKILGDAYYDGRTKTVRLTLNVDGQSRVVEQQVNW
jgi:hypothetical protein